jgi:hypothetical protein
MFTNLKYSRKEDVDRSLPTIIKLLNHVDVDDDALDDAFEFDLNADT